MAGLCKVLLVAVLAEYLLLLKHERRVLECLLTRRADKVFRMPHLVHGTSKGAPGSGV